MIFYCNNFANSPYAEMRKMRGSYFCRRFGSATEVDQFRAFAWVRRGGDQRSESARIKRADGTFGLARGSNNVEHLLRRIARDHPDIINRYRAGEFKSARAAAKEAGIIVEPDPVATAKKAFEKIPRQLRSEFIQWLRDNGYV